MSSHITPQTNELLSALQSRLRVWSAAVVVCLTIGWVFWTWSSAVPNVDRSGTPLGGDFLMFYTAGRIAQEDPLALYDESRQQAEFHRVIPGLEPGTCRLPYRYPPFVAVLMAPLSHLPFPIAFAVFTIVSISLAFLIVKMMDCMESHWFKESSGCFGWWLMGWPIALETIFGGQQSFVGLAIAVAVILLVQQRNYFWSGAILGLACYKPNLLLFFGIALVLRYPRMILGLACTAIAMLSFQLITVGPACVENYVTLARQLATESWGLETPANKVHGLAPWLAMFWPGYERKILLAVGLLGCILWAWCDRRISTNNTAQCMKADRVFGSKGNNRFVHALSMSCLVIWNAVCNPYLPVYDLLLLGIPTLLLLRIGSEQRISPRVLVWFMGIVSVGPHISQALANQIGLQLFPILLAIIGIGVAYLLGLRCFEQRNSVSRNVSSFHEATWEFPHTSSSDAKT
jgi:hypothetical protein